MQSLFGSREMENPLGSWRGGRLARIALVALGVLLLATALVQWLNARKTPFERAQEQADAANPHWLSIELDTADKRRVYKESEFVGFEVRYSSAVRQLYKAEVAEGYSGVAASDTLHFSDGRHLPLRIFGIVCCGSKLIGLNDEPYVYHPQLRVRLKTGTHELYLTTRRVLPRDVAPEVYSVSQWETASNMLKIRILADPGWQERLFIKIKASPSRGSLCDLAILDIPAATAQKLEDLRNGMSCGFQPFSESEYPAAVRGMEELIHSPTYGFTQGDATFVLQMRIWMSHPELRLVPWNENAFEKYLDAESNVHLASERSLIQELCGTLPAKLPDARKLTQKTIDSFTENRLLGIPPCRPDSGL